MRKYLLLVVVSLVVGGAPVLADQGVTIDDGGATGIGTIILTSTDSGSIVRAGDRVKFTQPATPLPVGCRVTLSVDSTGGVLMAENVIVTSSESTILEGEVEIEDGLEVTTGEFVMIHNADEIEIEGGILVDGEGSNLMILGGWLEIEGNILVDNGGFLMIDGAGGGDDDDSSDDSDGSAIEGNITVKRPSSAVILRNIELDGTLSTIQGPAVVSFDNVKVKGSFTTSDTATVSVFNSKFRKSITSSNDGRVIVLGNKVRRDINITNPGTCFEALNRVKGTNPGCP